MVLKYDTRVVVLVGGVGGAKLAYGLSRLLSSVQLTLIGNVGDDLEHFGLRISPDLDTVMYTLAGLANPQTGWGIVGDTWQVVESLQRFGEDAWFRIGDRDVATHLLRTLWLERGLTLTAVTARLLRGLNVAYNLLPVTDDPLATMIDTVDAGTLAFQEYFVRRRWEPAALRIWFRGAEQARMTDAVRNALTNADVIIIGPSNPLLSIAPILAVPGVRELIEQRRGACVALSPLIRGKAVKGPADKLMRELGHDVSARGIARFYEGLIDGLMIDEQDRKEADSVGVPVRVTRTLMQNDVEKTRVANELLEWVEGMML